MTRLGAEVLGVDFGGTKIASGMVDENGSVTGRRSVATRAAEGFEASIGQLWRLLDEAVTPQVQAIGICAPGPLNPKTGVVLNPPNLPGWTGQPLARLARERFHVPVILENDCNAAGLAEARLGAARGMRDVFYCAIGTGIGSAILMDGKIYYGKNGAAGEAGHVTIDYQSAVVCGCGRRGCIEALASGSAIEKHALHLDTLAERLSAWLGGIVSLLDPEMIVIGGGVAQMGEPLFARLRDLVPQRTINPYARDVPIVPAHFGSDAGIVGSSIIARESIHAEDVS